MQHFNFIVKQVAEAFKILPSRQTSEVRMKCSWYNKGLRIRRFFVSRIINETDVL